MLQLWANWGDGMTFEIGFRERRRPVTLCVQGRRRTPGLPSRLPSEARYVCESIDEC